MRIELHPLADAEAMEAAHWYENQQVGLGGAFLNRLRESYRKIERSPHRFARLETLKLNWEARRVIVVRFPYLVIYEITVETINVYAIAHASRRPNYWTDRRSSS